MQISTFEFQIHTTKREEFIPVSEQISSYLKQSKIQNGFCKIFVPHTTAAITINENADPDVTEDITNYLNELIPIKREFHHVEGNSDAHIKSSLIGVTLDVPICYGHFVLGQWQGIYFVECDGPRNRRIILQFYGE